MTSNKTYDVEVSYPVPYKLVVVAVTAISADAARSAALKMAEDNPDLWSQDGYFDWFEAGEMSAYVAGE